MLSVIHNAISLTRGDSATLRLQIKKEDGRDYEIAPDDTIVFTVKKSTRDTAVVLQKAAIYSRIEILARETEALEYRTYYYDVELRKADGFVATVISPSPFKITEEVTF